MSMHAGYSKTTAAEDCAPCMHISIILVKYTLQTLQVGWPLSVVLDNRALGQYQLLLRHLLELELVQRALHAAWRVYQQARPLFRRALLPTPLSPSYSICSTLAEAVPSLSLHTHGVASAQDRCMPFVTRYWPQARHLLACISSAAAV